MTQKMVLLTHFFIFAALLLATTAAPTTCPALQKCIPNLPDSPPSCPLFPLNTLPRTIRPVGYNLIPLREGIYSFDDGAYLSLIIYRGVRLVLTDFPDYTSAVHPDGSTKLISAIAEAVAGGVVKYVDMIYSHRHRDHIRRAGIVMEYLQKTYPDVKVNIFGSAETRKFLSENGAKIPIPNKKVGRNGKRISLPDGTTIMLIIFGGHTMSDIATYILPTPKDGGVLHYVDVITPRNAPFLSFGVTSDMTGYVKAHEKVLQLEFEYFSGGHGDVGSKKDVMINLEYVNFVVKSATESLHDFDKTKLRELVLKVRTPGTPEFGNGALVLAETIRLQSEACYRKVLIEWGCVLNVVDVLAMSHCRTAVIHGNIEF